MVKRVLLDEGLNELATQFASLIKKAQWGTGTASPGASDTGLGSAIPNTLINVSATTSGNSAQFTHEVPSTVGNDYDLTEYELQFNNGDSLNRIAGGEISKTNSFEITTISTISFIRG